jgi:serpin B
MLHFKNIILPITFVCILSCCSDKITGNDNLTPLRALSTSEQAITEANNNFGLKLFRQIASIEAESNIFISPLSISMALGMAYNGADGETRSEMHSMLEFGDLTAEEINHTEA